MNDGIYQHHRGWLFTSEISPSQIVSCLVAESSQNRPTIQVKEFLEKLPRKFWNHKSTCCSLSPLILGSDFLPPLFRVHVYFALGGPCASKKRRIGRWVKKSKWIKFSLLVALRWRDESSINDGEMECFLVGCKMRCWLLCELVQDLGRECWLVDDG